ncbi:hypothetical protein RchiOBHm_Chr4g0422671 [Rosa chinensis]|uniref:Uncharacterized protein n=1 Tax=Rosa chinensis TaxID=74649 RepID=A0A2P6QYD9_ROSCH|nr:hypothetical protein RchiOBHm_Chr4g0422671 [Rosa chinensis]
MGLRGCRAFILFWDLVVNWFLILLKNTLGQHTHSKFASYICSLNS